jgi:ATP-binding cassette subfamily F protein uup
LLKILAGLETPDAGTRALRKGARLGCIVQDPRFDPAHSVERVLLDSLGELHIDETERHSRLGEILARFSFPDRDQLAATLSGGWRKRLAIARELVREPDVLLLDEPTNHLDIEGIVWLEKQLLSSSSAVLLVSHDRYFLQHVTRRVVELNRCYPKGYFSVSGNYADFLAKREEFLAAQAQQQSVLANKVRREIEWLKRGPPARTTKSAARIARAGELQSQLAEVRYRNAQNRSADIDFAASNRATKRLLVAEDLGFQFGDRRLFSGVNLSLAPGVKIGLLGRNGSGKSTLLKLLSGELSPHQGSIERAFDLRVAMFDQNRAQLDPDQLLRNALSPNGENVLFQNRPMHVVAWAKRFLFEPDQLARPLRSLSGGEQARVMIAGLMLQPADLLLLDEPTNDLDIASLEVLEDSLLEFPGAMVLVTHDRYLLDRVATEILALDDTGTARTFADLAQWQASQESEKSAPAVERRPSPAARKPAAVRLTYRERQELEGMEHSIASCEAAIAEHERELADPEVMNDHVRLRAACEQLESAQKQLEQLFARWQELESKSGV